MEKVLSASFENKYTSIDTSINDINIFFYVHLCIMLLLQMCAYLHIYVFFNINT